MNKATIEQFNSSMEMTGNMNTVIMRSEQGELTLYVGAMINVEELRVPDGVEAIRTFKDTSYIIGSWEQGEAIAEKFSRSMQIVRIHIPDSVEYIGALSFYKCGQLQEIYGGKNVRYIGNHAFTENIKLETVSFPKLAFINRNTFSGCDRLNDITVGTKCSVDKFAFSRCKQLKNVNGTLVELYVGALTGCDLLDTNNTVIEKVGNDGTDLIGGRCVGITAIQYWRNATVKAGKGIKDTHEAIDWLIENGYYNT